MDEQVLTLNCSLLQVLAKFPIIQHFLFGSLLSIDPATPPASWVLECRHRHQSSSVASSSLHRLHHLILRWPCALDGTLNSKHWLILIIGSISNSIVVKRIKPSSSSPWAVALLSTEFTVIIVSMGSSIVINRIYRHHRLRQQRHCYQQQLIVIAVFIVIRSASRCTHVVSSSSQGETNQATRKFQRKSVLATWIFVMFNTFCFFFFFFFLVVVAAFYVLLLGCFFWWFFFLLLLWYLFLVCLFCSFVFVVILIVLI